MANCLSTITNRAILEVEFPKGTRNYEILGFDASKPSIYNIGCIQYGQKRDISILIPKNTLGEGSIKFSLKYGSTFEAQNVL